LKAIKIHFHKLLSPKAAVAATAKVLILFPSQRWLLMKRHVIIGGKVPSCMAKQEIIRSASGKQRNYGYTTTAAAADATVIRLLN